MGSLREFEERFYGEFDQITRAEEALACLRRWEAAATGLERVPVCNELGRVCRELGDMAGSEDAFRGAMAALEEAGQEKSPAYGTVVLNLAGTCRLERKLEESAALFARAMELLPENSYPYVSAVNNLGLARQDQGRHEEAEALLERAMAWMKAQPGRELEVATSMSNLAAIRLKQNDLEGAEERLRAALAYYEPDREDDCHYPAALAVKGWLLLRREDWQGAAETFEKCMALTQARYGKNPDYEAARAGLEQARRGLDGVTP